MITPAVVPSVRRVEHVMGMPISLALRGRHASGARADDAWDAVLAVLRDADRVFSTYRDDSVISRLGRGEITLDDCPPEVGEVLEIGAAAHEASGGAFAVCRDGVLDPSGVVKGWAAERASVHLADLPDTDFCLSAGGDIVCRTVDTEGALWRVGIEDPRDPSRLIATVPVHTGALATSGTARRGAHIVDARTGRAPAGIASVTVIGDSLTAVDIDATAAFALGPDGEAWLARRGHHAALVVRGDGTTRVIATAASKPGDRG